MVKPVAIGSAVGTVVGILPAAGGDIGGIVARPGAALLQGAGAVRQGLAGGTDGCRLVVQRGRRRIRAHYPRAWSAR